MNLHEFQSKKLFAGYGIPAPAGAYRMILDTDDREFGGHGRLASGQEHHTLMAPDNPWGSATLEWATTSPPPHENFTHEVEAGDPYWFDNGKIKPEYLINLNAGAIVLLQVLIAYLVRKTTPLVSIIAGVTVTIASFLVYLAGATGWVVWSPGNKYGVSWSSMRLMPPAPILEGEPDIEEVETEE